MGSAVKVITLKRETRGSERGGSRESRATVHTKKAGKLKRQRQDGEFVAAPEVAVLNGRKQRKHGNNSSAGGRRKFRQSSEELDSWPEADSAVGNRQTEVAGDRGQPSKMPTTVKNKKHSADSDGSLGTASNRKRTQPGMHKPSEGISPVAVDRSVSQSGSRNKKQQTVVVELAQQEATLGRLKPLPELPTAASAAEQAQWLWAAFVAQAGSRLSVLEHEPFTADHVQAMPNTGSSALLEYLKETLAPPFLDVGSPRVLLLCSAALRCTQVLRELKGLKSIRTAKLFAKHIKVEEQVALLQQPVQLAAGTPNRVGQLAALGALNLDDLQLLVLDLQSSPKGLTLLDIPELRVDFWEFFRVHLYDRARSGDMRICLLRE